MRALEASGNAIGELISLKKLRDFGIVVGVVEDVGGREAIGLSYVLQSPHYDLE